PCPPRISAQAGPGARRPGGPAGPERASPDLLWQLRLAQLRPRLLASDANAAALPRDGRRAARSRAAGRDADARECLRRARLSRPRLYRRVRAALRLGLAARAPCRGAAARGRMGGQPRAARRGFRRAVRPLSAQADLSD